MTKRSSMYSGFRPYGLSVEELLAQDALDELEEAEEEEAEQKEEPEPEPDPEPDADSKARGDYLEDPEPEPKDKDKDKEEPKDKDESKDKEEPKEGDDKPGPDFIPRYRYNRVAERNKELQRELDRLQAERQEPAASGQGQEEGQDLDTQLTEIDQQITAAVKDGKADDLPALFAQQRQLQDQRYEQRLLEQTQTTSRMTQDEIRYDQRVAEIEQEYPMLNPDNEAFDADLAANVGELLDAFEAMGYPRAEALDKAIGHSTPLLAQPPAKDEPSVKDPPPPKAEDRKRSADASRRQPPSTTGVGEDSNKHGMNEQVDVTKLSEEEFDALPDSVLKRIRGDTPA